MKRIFSAILCICLLLSCLMFAACGTKDVPNDTSGDTENSEQSTPQTEPNTPTDDGKAELIAALKAAFLEKADAVVVSEDSVTFTDASGDGNTTVTVPINPASVVNLYASFTTLWYEAGGEVVGCIGGSSSVELYKEYIGRDITADAGMTVVAESSSGKKWNVESIVALRPELIICSTAMSGYATIEKPAAAAEIPLIAVEYNDFSDYLKWFKVFCNLSGHPERWESVAMKTLDEVVEILVACPTENTPSVFAMFSGADSLQANTSETVVGGMITAMNAKNIVDNWPNTSRADRLEINLETVFAADPDIIVVQCHAGAEVAKAAVDETYGSNPVWQSLTAVKEGRVYYLEKELFHNKPNSRFAEAYRILASYLYPNLDLTNKTES